MRAEQLATLSRIAHERFASDEIGRLLEDLRPFEEALAADSDEASLVRVSRRDWEKARRVPADLRAELTRAAALAYEAWAEARRQSDFGAFLPFLRTNVELKHRYVECFDSPEELYDVLLDDYERGMKTSEVRAVFNQLKRGLVPFLAAVHERADSPPESFFGGGSFSASFTHASKRYTTTRLQTLGRSRTYLSARTWSTSKIASKHMSY